MRSRPAVITIVTASLFSVLVGFGVWIGVNAAVMPACARCHMTGEFATQTESSAHGSLPCKSCHGGATVTSRVQFGAAQVFGMQLPVVDTDPTLSTVVSSKCQGCHKRDLAGITESGGLRVKHSVCGIGSECTDCHSTTAHGAALAWPRTVTMEACYSCHADTGATTKCDGCHIGRLPSERVQTGAFQVTHGPNHTQTHGMGEMSTCGACHAESKCQKCHGAGVPHVAKFLDKHAAASTSQSAKCEGCHTKRFCFDCHRYPMPHPASFKPKHSAIVKRDGDTDCMRCHVESDCSGCHVMHVHPTTLEQLEGLGVTPPSDEATR